ncbi:MAG: hypothetical protein LC808_06345 [Actinobacteria bacterium]|nr:hypothetical protein [Actinomycetota bacterium]
MIASLGLEGPAALGVELSLAANDQGAPPGLDAGGRCRCGDRARNVGPAKQPLQDDALVLPAGGQRGEDSASDLLGIGNLEWSVPGSEGDTPGGRVLRSFGGDCQGATRHERGEKLFDAVHRLG